MRNTGLGESQAGIETSGRNSNNPRYEDDTTLIAESKEELKNLLMKRGCKESDRTKRLNENNTGQLFCSY